jgi:hypothetical protein
MFDAFGLRFFLRFKLRSDTSMAGATLTISTDRTANRYHWQSPEPDAVCTETHQLNRVCRGADSAVSPEFNFFAQTSLGQSAMRIHDSDFGGESNISQ